MPVAGSPAAVTDRAVVGPDNLTRPPLAHLVNVAEMGRSFSLGGGPHHFLPPRPAAWELSSIAFANSFFSRAFSSSNTRSRRASDTSRPPYLAFHLMGWTALPFSTEARCLNERGWMMDVGFVGIDLAKNISAARRERGRPGCLATPCPAQSAHGEGRGTATAALEHLQEGRSAPAASSSLMVRVPSFEQLGHEMMLKAHGSGTSKRVAAAPR